TPGDTKCRFACATHTDCPLNYHCDPNDGGSGPYCVADKYTYDPSAKGLWGAPCQANLGFQNNPACDGDQGFWANGNSTADGSAFCTTYGCVEDADCGHGFYCGKVNRWPNVTTTRRSTGQTDSLCLPRDYCAPCTTDIDCGGGTNHCVVDASGTGSYCTSECA